jgi:hypothetical protein
MADPQSDRPAGTPGSSAHVRLTAPLPVSVDRIWTPNVHRNAWYYCATPDAGTRRHIPATPVTESAVLPFVVVEGCLVWRSPCNAVAVEGIEARRPGRDQRSLGTGPMRL